jgi:hypothetical protein
VPAAVRRSAEASDGYESHLTSQLRAPWPREFVAIEAGHPNIHERKPSRGPVTDLWAEVSVHPSPSGLSISAQDVTARKKAELALAESEAR